VALWVREESGGLSKHQNILTDRHYFDLKIGTFCYFFFFRENHTF